MQIDPYLDRIEYRVYVTQIDCSGLQSVTLWPQGCDRQGNT